MSENKKYCPQLYEEKQSSYEYLDISLKDRMKYLVLAKLEYSDYFKNRAKVYMNSKPACHY
jgi:hypothetical protein